MTWRRGMRASSPARRHVRPSPPGSGVPAGQYSETGRPACSRPTAAASTGVSPARGSTASSAAGAAEAGSRHWIRHWKFGGQKKPAGQGPAPQYPASHEGFGARPGRVRQPAWPVAKSPSCFCPGRKPPFSAVQRPARPYRSAIQKVIFIGKRE